MELAGATSLLEGAEYCILYAAQLQVGSAGDEDEEPQQVRARSWRVRGGE
jgi:hypothetical protein